MRVYLVNPSDVSFGTAIIAPRWLYVLAAATPPAFGDPVIVDEALEPVDSMRIQPGDVVGIGIHTSNALRGYEVGRIAHRRGAHVIFGGIHASLYPQEAYQLGQAHAVVKGDGDVVWAKVLADCTNGGPRQLYEGGRIEADGFLPARWDLMPVDRYMWASVQTVRGCPKHCSFCSVWRTDGQRPRERTADVVIQEIVELRRMGFRFIVLADDNFYPVTLNDLKLAETRNNQQRLGELQAMRKERFELMARLAQLPEDMVLFTQITMEVADDPEFLDAMRKARIKGALVGIESVTEEGLKAVYKEFNCSGDRLVRQLQTFRQHGVYVLGSFIFGLPTDRPETFEATTTLAQEAELAFAQFVTLVPYPGTVDFLHWEKRMKSDTTRIAGIPLTRYWLIPRALRPRLCVSHSLMSAEEIRQRTQGVWDRFYSLPLIWKRSRTVRSLRSRLTFVVMSKLFRQMFANIGIATDSARIRRAATWARWMAKLCRPLFLAPPMPQLQVPGSSCGRTVEDRGFDSQCEHPQRK
ncbi:B12-binding domain-containing radical SAM protein [Acidobacteria bacterium AH-259-A15]|nr:B12-binding domain-containing radical SAM protein [Acidobacteria bacterium AH-259-A15]